MSFSHEAIAALPVLTDADKALIRALCTRRIAYALSAAESAQDFIAVDVATGILPLYLIQNNTIFQYDSTDSTTAHDGVTCLVTNDSKRYKSDTVAYPWSVLDKDTTAQPVSPTVGDRYLLPAAATGTDWAGHDDEVAIYTAAGWRFAIVPIGRFLYVEDETAFYHRNAAGDWTAGIGGIAIGADTVSLSAIKGSGIRSITKVENQTTNAPPASPVAPVAYIIGSSPTGAWAGKAGQVAICEVDGAWVYYVPDVGDEVFDIALNYRVLWNGAAWISSRGVSVAFAREVTTSGSQSSSAGAAYNASDTVPPTTNTAFLKDDSTIQIAARNAANVLDVHYSFMGGAGVITVALFRGSDVPVFETNAIAWVELGDGTSGHLKSVHFVVPVPDTLVHTYQIRTNVPGSGTAPSVALTRRVFTIDEKVLA